MCTMCARAGLRTSDNLLLEAVREVEVVRHAEIRTDLTNVKSKILPLSYGYWSKILSFLFSILSVSDVKRFPFSILDKMSIKKILNKISAAIKSVMDDRRHKNIKEQVRTLQGHTWFLHF